MCLPSIPRSARRYATNAKGNRYLVFDAEADGSRRIADEHHLIPIAGIVFEPRQNAQGGMMPRGVPYMVGEHGPEVFTPDGPGEVRRSA